MPVCPVCEDEFEDGVETCPDDGAALVADSGVRPQREVVEGSLGTFHPRMATELRRLLETRGVAHRLVEVDDDRTELRVPAELRETLRAELTLSWASLLRVLPPDEAPAVLAVGTEQHPGWHDAPQGAWVDDQGRLRVATADDEAMADAERSTGPVLAALGVVTCLLAWATGGSDVLYLLGGTGVVLGLLLPR